MSFDGDVLVKASEGFGIEFINGQPKMTTGFETAVQFSWFGGNIDDSGVRADDREQYWGNYIDDETNRHMRSRVQYILEFLPINAANLQRLRRDALKDILWLKEAKIADTVEVSVSLVGPDRVKLTALITAEGKESSFEFTANWQSSSPSEAEIIADVAAEGRPVQVLERIPFIPSTVSVSFTSSGQLLQSEAQESVGIGNVWSFSQWWKRVAVNQYSIFDILPDTGEANRISLVQRASTFEGFDLSIKDSAGTLIFQQVILKDLIFSGPWFNIAATWNGTTLLMYLDGVLQTSPGDLEDILSDPGTLTDTPRRIELCGETDLAAFGFGLHFSLGLWDKVLAASEILALYNGGDAAAIDLSAASGSYTSFANLKHWYRLGLIESDLGRDYGLMRRDLISSGGEFQPVDADDIVSEVPT